MEVVALVGAHWDYTRALGKAMEVARDVKIHIGNLVGIEVVRRRGGELPVFRRSDVARHTEVLRDLPLILQLVIVELAVAVVD